MIRVALIAVGALALSATSAFAESYNIVCPIAAMGTEQVGTATIAKGYIFSLDFDAKQACHRVNNACTPESFAVADGVAQLDAKDVQSVTFDIETHVLTVMVEGATAKGTCRRAPFTPF
jgi:hypothetical protein